MWWLSEYPFQISQGLVSGPSGFSVKCTNHVHASILTKLWKTAGELVQSHYDGISKICLGLTLAQSPHWPDIISTVAFQV